jgi:hypothetical protein
MAAEDRHAAGQEQSRASAVRPLVERWLRWSREAVTEIWADRISRWCGLAAFFSLWLTVSLTEPAFLALFLGTGAGIWLRRGPRAAAAAAVGDDDWL